MYSLILINPKSMAGVGLSNQAKTTWIPEPESLTAHLQFVSIVQTWQIPGVKSL